METLILILAALITSSISAIIGMGGGIILLGVMAIIIPEGYMVIALHGIIQLVSNTTRTYVFKSYLHKRIIKEFSIGATIGWLASALIILFLINYFEVNSANEIKIDILKPIIGCFILWYLYIKKPGSNKKIKTFIPVGAISGLSSIFIGATGPLIAPFYLSENINKEEIIANKAACQMITHLSKIPLFLLFFNVDYFAEYSILLPLILAVFIGTNFGKKVLRFIPENIFRKIFSITLSIIAIKLIVQNFI